MLDHPGAQIGKVGGEQIGGHDKNNQRDDKRGQSHGLLSRQPPGGGQQVRHGNAQPLHQAVDHRLHQLRHLGRNQGEQVGQEGLHLVQRGLQVVQQAAPVLHQRDQLSHRGIAQQADRSADRPKEDDEHQSGQYVPIPAQQPLQPLDQGVEQSRGDQGAQEGGKQRQQRRPELPHQPHRQSDQQKADHQPQPELAPLPPGQFVKAHMQAPFLSNSNAT